MSEQITDRQHRRARKAHVLVHHPGMVLLTAGQVCDQSLVGEFAHLNRLQLAVNPDRGGLRSVVPLPQLLAPDLVLPHHLRPSEALRDVALRYRMDRVVCEPVDVLRLHRFDEGPAVRHEFTCATAEGLRVRFGEVPRRRARKVDGVEAPRTRARRLEVKRWRHRCSHVSLPGLAFRHPPTTWRKSPTACWPWR